MGSYSELKNPARAVWAFEPRPEKTGVKSQVSSGENRGRFPRHISPRKRKSFRPLKMGDRTRVFLIWETSRRKSSFPGESVLIRLFSLLRSFVLANASEGESGSLARRRRKKSRTGLLFYSSPSSSLCDRAHFIASSSSCTLHRLVFCHLFLFPLFVSFWSS